MLAMNLEAGFLGGIICFLENLPGLSSVGMQCDRSSGEPYSSPSLTRRAFLRILAQSVKPAPSLGNQFTDALQQINYPP